MNANKLGLELIGKNWSFIFVKLAVSMVDSHTVAAFKIPTDFNDHLIHATAKRLEFLHICSFKLKRIKKNKAWNDKLVLINKMLLKLYTRVYRRHGCCLGRWMNVNKMLPIQKADHVVSCLSDESHSIWIGSISLRLIFWPMLLLSYIDFETAAGLIEWLSPKLFVFASALFCLMSEWFVFICPPIYWWFAHDKSNMLNVSWFWRKQASLWQLW